MESIYVELALYGIKNKCAGTDIFLFPISEFCDSTVSLIQRAFQTSSQATKITKLVSKVGTTKCKELLNIEYLYQYWWEQKQTLPVVKFWFAILLQSTTRKSDPEGP